VLKQAVGGLDEIPEGVVEAFRDREVIGGQFLQAISASRRTVHLYALMPKMSVQQDIG